MNNIRETYGVYNNFKVADAETGLIFLSTNDKDLGTDISQNSYFTGALMPRKNYITNIQLAQQSRTPVFYTSHAIIDTDGKILAVVIAEVNAEDMLKPILHTGEGLGTRGEALLVNQDSRILTSLKHPLSDKTYAKPLEYRIKAKPASLAARGEEGIIESQDYRGKPVLAAYRHIRIFSEWGWGLIVKSDRTELFKPLRKDMIYAFLSGLIGILCIIGLTILLARNLTNPIRSLNETAIKIAEGDLDARASTTTSDEVGHLAMTFNSMVNRLQDW